MLAGFVAGWGLGQHRMQSAKTCQYGRAGRRFDGAVDYNLRIIIQTSASAIGHSRMPHSLPRPDLAACGLSPAKTVYANPSVPVLVETSLGRQESHLTDTGALNAHTGSRTGRSPKDRFIVRDAETETLVNWGNVNQPVDRATFDRVMSRAIEHLNQQ